MPPNHVKRYPETFNARNFTVGRRDVNDSRVETNRALRQNALLERLTTMTVADVREYLRMSPASVYRGLNRGEIPAERVGGKWIIKRKAFFDKFGWPLAGPAERQPRRSAIQSPHETSALHFRTASTDTRGTKAESIQASDALRPAKMVEVDEVMKEPDPASRGTPENPWRDVAHAATRLNCSEPHLRMLCRGKEIQFYRVGRYYFFVDKWLDEYIDKHSGGNDAA